MSWLQMDECPLDESWRSPFVPCSVSINPVLWHIWDIMIRAKHAWYYHHWPFSVLMLWLVEFGHCSDVKMEFKPGKCPLSRHCLEGCIRTMSVLLALQLPRICDEDFLLSSTSCVIRLLIRPTGSAAWTSRPNRESWIHTCDEQSKTTGPTQSQWQEVAPNVRTEIRHQDLSSPTPNLEADVPLDDHKGCSDQSDEIWTHWLLFNTNDCKGFTDY